MREARVNAKCRFRLDSDGWMEVWDGYQSASFAPDEVEALRLFLAPAAERSGAPEGLPEGSNPSKSPDPEASAGPQGAA
jgi:hypothetical protein